MDGYALRHLFDLLDVKGYRFLTLFSLHEFLQNQARANPKLKPTERRM